MPVSDEQTVPYISRDELERRARDVLREHGLTSIPIDPVVLANRLGMSVRNAKFSDETLVGMIAKRGTNVQLLVNQSDSPYRKRFTIAHELGHHFLHLLEDGEFIDGDHDFDMFRGGADDTEDVSPKRRQEIQANIFASALLMPAAAVREMWSEVDSVQGMARLFNVSEAAMKNRLRTLGLRDEQKA
jgi:Zn-dependent peptidase ImmA (M78 family)